MALSPRIVYDWNHSGVATIILDISRARPKAPPPPRWSWGSADLTSPSSDSEASVSKENDGFKGMLVEDREDSSIRILEYNHGLPVTPITPDDLLRNPLYKSSSEKSENEKGLLDSPGPLVDTERKCPLSQDLQEQTHTKWKSDERIPANEAENSSCMDETSHNETGNCNENVPREGKRVPKRKHTSENEDDEIMIGQKLSKSRVAVSSRMYAKPSKRPQISCLVNGCENAENMPGIKENPEKSEPSDKTETKSNEGDRVKENPVKESIFSTSVTSEPEDIIIDVSPYDILQIEEQLQLMEDGEEYDEMPTKPLCDNSLEDDDVEDLPEIKIRTDIWEVDEENTDM